MPKFFLTSMLVFKDEAIYLKEWLDYNILLGFQHFYLYDNQSSDKPLKVLKWYIDNDIVSYHQINRKLGFESLSWPHREENIKQYGSDSEWMAFFDIDEFICLNDLNDNLHLALSKFEDFSGIAVRAVNYGSNGHMKYKKELVIKRFDKRALVPATYKSIIRPLDVSGCITGHCFLIKKDVKNPFTVDVKTRQIDPDNTGWLAGNGHIKNDRFYLNHYKFKSKEEFLDFKNKNPELRMDSKMYSEERFKREQSLTNAVIARKIQFFIPYLKNDFVQKHYAEISEYYSQTHKNHGLLSFLSSFNLDK